MNQASYVESGCVFEHKGRQFELGGAIITDEWIVGYVGKFDPATQSRSLTDWHGKILGACRIVATWKTPRSYISSTMHQIEATVNGVRYTGRSAGTGMIYRGKRAKRQP